MQSVATTGPNSAGPDAQAFTASDSRALIACWSLLMAAALSFTIVNSLSRQPPPELLTLLLPVAAGQALMLLLNLAWLMCPPALRIDESGLTRRALFESSRTIPWAAIERIELQNQLLGRLPMLCIYLKPATAPTHVTRLRLFFSRGRPMMHCAFGGLMSTACLRETAAFIRNLRPEVMRVR